MKTLSDIRCFGGRQLRYQHTSTTCQCEMTFSLYLPPQAAKEKVPVLYWLSGLTCTDENFVQKAGAQRYASEHGIAIVIPDTSPRGEGVPDDTDNHWDFGLGAGFYLNATQSPWSAHYKMYDYITQELPELLHQRGDIDTRRQAISGHSMGGHGALTIALKNPDKYCSVSAFAPICAPMQCAWGKKAFSQYLGSEKQTWEMYDTTQLIAHTDTQLPILIDQGSADSFLIEQLKPEQLRQAANNANYPLTLRMQEGYDHSYFFINSFISEHITFHAHNIRYLA